MRNSHPSEQRRAAIEAKARRAERQRLQEQRQERAARHDIAGTVLGQVRGFLATLPPSTVLEAIPLAKPQMRTGETVLEAIARVRGELAAAHCELMQLRAAPLPLDDLKEMATEALSNSQRHHCRCRAGSSTSPGQGPVAVLAWVNAEQVIARLHRQIERLPAPANALSAAERNRRTTEINARILDLESEERRWVEAALDAGHDGVSRREVVSPPVVLGVRISTRARATGWPAHARKDG